MPIIFSYPQVSTVNNQDLFVISRTSSGIPETKSVEAEEISTYVKSTVDLNVVAQDATNTLVNLASQSLTITGSANEIETRVPTGQVLQIGLPDNVTIANNLSVGIAPGANGNLTVGGNGSQSSIAGFLNLGEVFVNDTLEVDGDTILNNDLYVGGHAQIDGSLDMTLSRINNVLDPTQPQDAATKQYVDTAVTGLLEFKGTFRADSGLILSGANNGLYLYNCPGGAGTRVAVNTGDYYIVANTGGQFYCSGDLLQIGDSIFAVADAAADSSTISDWGTLEGNNVEGLGLINSVPLWTDTQTLGSSNITQEATKILIDDDLEITGDATFPNAVNITNATSSSAGIIFTHPAGGASGIVNMYYNGTTAGSKFVISRSSTGGPEIELQSNGDINLNKTGNGNVFIGNTLEVSGDIEPGNDVIMGGGNIFMANGNISSLAAPSAGDDAATKDYVDGLTTANANAITDKVAKAGDTMSGDLTILKTTGNPVLTVKNEETTGTSFQAAIVSVRAEETSTNTTSRGTIIMHGPNSLNTGGAGNLVIQNQTVAGGQVVIAPKDATTTYFNRFKTNGQVQFEEYGSGTLTGTAAYNISVDASGNLIETPNSSGGGAWTTLEVNLSGNVLANAFNGNLSDAITLVTVPANHFAKILEVTGVIYAATSGTTDYNANNSLYVKRAGSTTGGSFSAPEIMGSFINSSSDRMTNSNGQPVAAQTNNLSSYGGLGTDIVLGPSTTGPVTITQGDRTIKLSITYRLIDFTP